MSIGSKIFEIGVFGYRCLDSFGINLGKSMRAIRGVPHFIRDYYMFISQKRSPKYCFRQGIPSPCLVDRYLPCGTAKGAYFYQDLLVAQKIFKNTPVRHLDVGSSVAGFVSNVASFRTIEVIDIRPLSTQAKNISFRQADITSKLDRTLISCCDSLSCLHALEHFGLGRYGDPVNPSGFIDGWNNLHQMLSRGGTLYFSAPLGSSRIEFNAHRVFSIQHFMTLISRMYDILDFAYVDDNGDLHANQLSILHSVQANDNYGCRMGTAIFELRKI